MLLLVLSLGCDEVQETKADDMDVTPNTNLNTHTDTEEANPATTDTSTGTENFVDTGDAASETSTLTETEDTGEDCSSSFDVNHIALPAGDYEFLSLSEPLEGGIAFVQDGETLSAYSHTGVELWAVHTGGGRLFSGFDFDADGWPDAGLVQTQDTGELCGAAILKESWILFISGQTGQLVSGVSPLEDICWTFDTANGPVTYPTQQWVTQSIVWGDVAGMITLSPYYATNAYFFQWDATSGFHSESLLYPSTASFDALYTAAQPSPYASGNSFIEFSHLANGLMLQHLGQNKLVFFTSGRVLQYEVSALSEAQLLVDHPYLNGERTELAGRNYGLVSRDKANPNELVLIAGTDVYSVYQDLLHQQQGYYDPWGQIERHVTRYNLSTNQLEHRFFSYTHDDNDGHQYYNRVVFPTTAVVPTSHGTASRLAYNVYKNGHWSLHISEPGGTADSFALLDVFLWDIVDVDEDGTEEWFISPTGSLSSSNTAEAYFPKWEVGMYHWSETTLSLELLQYWNDRIPALRPMNNHANKTSSLGYLVPIMTKVVGCEKAFATLQQDGTQQWIVP